MVDEIFSTLNSIATLIGWLAILAGIGWFLKSYQENREAMKEHLADREAKLQFENFLKRDHPEKFFRYEQIKEMNVIRGENVHWTQIAMECDVPYTEVTKKRV